MEKIPQSETATPAPPADWRDTHALAEAGDVQAQFALAVSYSTGHGHPQDLPQAAKWYRLAADQNHALAQFNLGLMLAAGEGATDNDHAALHWIGRAAEAGDAGAQFYLGNHYHRASFDRLAESPAELRMESYQWFRLAADQGYRNSTLHYERLTINMSRAEVTQANERLARRSVTRTAASIV